MTPARYLPRISRGYVIALVCLFGFCALEDRTRKHPLVQACALALLANTSSPC